MIGIIITPITPKLCHNWWKHWTFLQKIYKQLKIIWYKFNINIEHIESCIMQFNHLIITYWYLLIIIARNTFKCITESSVIYKVILQALCHTYIIISDIVIRKVIHAFVIGTITSCVIRWRWIRMRHLMSAVVKLKRIRMACSITCSWK